MSSAPLAVEPVPREALGRMVGRRLRDWVPAIVVLVGTLVIWQALVVGLHVKQFLLPKPTAIAQAFWTNRSELLHAGWFTFQEALGGFVIGSGLAIVVVFPTEVTSALTKLDQSITGATAAGPLLTMLSVSKPGP